MLVSRGNRLALVNHQVRDLTLCGAREGNQHIKGETENVATTDQVPQRSDTLSRERKSENDGPYWLDGSVLALDDLPSAAQWRPSYEVCCERSDPFCVARAQKPA